LRIPFDHALKEAIAVQTLSLDMPGARLSLAQLLAAQGRNQEAQALLREGLNRIPADGEMHYALGLLLAQDGKTEESRDSLQKAAKWLPRHARVHYNLGLALQQLGQTRSAEQALLRAAQADETDADIAYALAAWYYKRQQYKETRIWVEKLKHAYPSDPRLAPLERALGGRAH
jgi:tetratricopeptide (TPR) repeat protein